MKSPAPLQTQPPSNRGEGAGVSLNAFLTRLIWLCVVPLLLLASYLAVDSVRSSRADRDDEAANLAKNFATAIDQNLAARIDALRMLADSPLANDDARRADFYVEAQAYKHNFGSHVILADVGLRMLFNTRVPLGTALPMLPRPQGRAAAPAALQTGAPVVGDIVQGPIAGETLVAIAVPGKRDGKDVFLLLTVMETRRFQERIDQLALPAGWSLALLDGTGAAIARRLPPGMDSSRDVDGAGRFIARLQRSSWSVVLEIPRDVYRESMVAQAIGLVLLVFGAVLAGILGGKLAGRRLALSVASLAQTLEPGAPPPRIREIATARRLLDQAADLRAAAEAELRAHEQQLQLVADHAPVLLAHCDRERRYIFVNVGYANLFGLQPQDMVGRHLRDVLGEEAYARASPYMDAVLAGKLVEYDLELPATPVGRRVVHVSYGPEHDASGGVVGFVAAILDITERKTAEEALRESEMSYRTLIENAADAIFVVNPDGRLRQANSRACEMFGYSAEEFIGMPASAIVAPDDAAAQRETLQRVAAGERVSVTRSYRRKDGSVFPVEINACQTVGGLVLGIVRDITERKQLETRLRDQLDELVRWQSAMLGREDRVQVLKAEVNELLAARGQAARYPSQTGEP